MFTTNVMNFTSRVEIARHGFESVTLHLAHEYQHFKEICARHGIEISATRVRDVVSHFEAEPQSSRAWRRILEQTTAARAASVSLLSPPAGSSRRLPNAWRETGSCRSCR